MRTLRWSFVFALAASAGAPLLAAPSEARAEWDPVVHRSDAGAELYLWSADDYGASLAAVPFVQLEPTPDVFLNMRFPVALGFDTPRGDAIAGLGNPTFSIYYSDISGRLTWYAGGRIAAPVGLIDDLDFRYANATSARAMGYYDPFLWASDTLPFGGLGGIEHRFARFFVLRAGGDLTFFPSLSSGRRYIAFNRSDDLDVSFQAKVEPEFQSRSGFGGGMSVMTVWVPTENNDNAQLSLLPYFAYDSQKTFFMRLGALIALDRPLGPGFDDGNVASLYLQLGGHLE
jgi:hypothetical protein